jgi:hypothetical protein
MRLVITNQGGAAEQVQLTRLVLRTLSGSGNATVNAPTIPPILAPLDQGEVCNVTLNLLVPARVCRLSIMQVGTVRISERQAQFLTSQKFIVK